MLSGREYAAGHAEWNGERVAIGHYVHIAGKDFADIHAELKAHLDQPDIAAQAMLPVTIADTDAIATPGDMLSRLARQSGLALNNIAVALVDKNTGLPLTPGQKRTNSIALGFNKVMLAKTRAELAELGISDAFVTCRILNAIGALRLAMRRGEVFGPVLCASILPAVTQLFIVTSESVTDIGEAEYGYSNILAQIMTDLSLKFEGSAARLFFGNLYDFDDKGDALSSPLASKIRVKLETYKGERPKSLMISGLPPARTRMFARHVSMALGINQLSLPILVEAIDGGLPTMPAVGAPSLVHMLVSSARIIDNPPFYLNLSKVSLDVTDYWTAEPVHEEKAKGPIRYYRGTAFGADGEALDLPEKKHSDHKDTPIRKILRYYRGNPIYEDDTADETPKVEEPKDTKPSKRVILRYYRGNPVYSDDERA